MSSVKQSVPAILGGEKAVVHAAPSWPISGDQEAQWLSEIARSGVWSWMGPHETAFTAEYAEFIGTKYCLAMANGTVTLQCALQACGVEPGDEVIVPGLTWVATAQAAMDIGANVVLVDIDAATLCMDPDAIRAAITPRTRAIIPVHLYGCMCDMDAIMAIAEEHQLKVIEDVAHQHGSRWRDVGAGAIGHAGSFSFQLSKVLTAGEGGAVTCNDREVFQTAFALKQVGWMPNPDEPLVMGEKPNLVPGNHYGHNYRITEMQAALLRAGLQRLPEQTAKREENARYLTEKLKEIGGPLQAVPRDPRVTRQAYYAMTFTFNPELAQGLNRERYLAALSAEGCGWGTPYPPVYRSPLLNLYDQTSPIPYRDAARVQNYAELKLPAVEQAVGETGVILMHQHLLGPREYMDQILTAIEKVNQNLAAIASAE